MKIGILTFHKAYNCGAMLQAWALGEVLRRMGHTVEYPDCNSVGYFYSGLCCRDVPIGKHGLNYARSFLGRLLLDLTGRRVGVRQGPLYNKFRKLHLKERNIVPSEFGKQYDCIVVGSDQVFNPSICGAWANVFLCEDVPDCVKRISYAASIGDVGLKSADACRLDAALRKFSAVSVREPFNGYPVVADPTLLLDRSDYEQLKGDRANIPNGDYVYMYSCPCSDFEVKLARKMASRLGMQLVITPVYPEGLKHRISEVVDLLSPVRMIQYIKHAKYVIAGSFHATVFSILFNKPFISVRNGPIEKGSRQLLLLERLGMPNRVVCPVFSGDDIYSRLVKPLPQDVMARVLAFREESIAWLENAIGGTKS